MMGQNKTRWRHHSEPPSCSRMKKRSNTNPATIDDRPADSKLQSSSSPFVTRGPTVSSPPIQSDTNWVRVLCAELGTPMIQQLVDLWQKEVELTGWCVTKSACYPSREAGLFLFASQQQRVTKKIQEFLFNIPQMCSSDL